MRRTSRLSSPPQILTRKLGACVFAALIGLTSAVVSFTADRAYAQAGDELLTITTEGTSKNPSQVEASREIQSQVIAETARRQITDVLGEKRYQKNRAQIENRIVKQAPKFIPYVNAGQAVAVPGGGWKMPVELRISMASLRKMVVDAGFLNDAEGSASILPMIAFVDRQRGVAQRWWLGEQKGEAQKYLTQLSRLVHDQLQAEFSRQGFHLIKPLTTKVSPLPEAYRTERPTSQDLVGISDYFKSPLIMKGETKFRESPDVAGVGQIVIKLQVIQASNQRSIGEVSRSFETEAGPLEAVVRTRLTSEMPEIARDLATQVLEAWQRGTLNTNLVRLAVRGNLNPKQIADFRSAVLGQVREVKSLKERVFSDDQIVFEADTTGNAAQLAGRLQTLKLPAFETRVAENSAGSIVMDVKVR